METAPANNVYYGRGRVQSDGGDQMLLQEYSHSQPHSVHGQMNKEHYRHGSTGKNNSQGPEVRKS